jgi:hypothetical protein
LNTTRFCRNSPCALTWLLRAAIATVLRGLLGVVALAVVMAASGCTVGLPVARDAHIEAAVFHGLRPSDVT